MDIISWNPTAFRLLLRVPKFFRQSPLEISEFDLAGVWMTWCHDSRNLARCASSRNTIREHGPCRFQKDQAAGWNLLNNAVKALQEKGEVEINLFQDAGRWSFPSTIRRRHGPGGGGKIFTPFYSKFAFASASHEYRQEIVEEHGSAWRSRPKKILAQRYAYASTSGKYTAGDDDHSLRNMLSFVWARRVQVDEAVSGWTRSRS